MVVVFVDNALADLIRIDIDPSRIQSFCVIPLVGRPGRKRDSEGCLNVRHPTLAKPSLIVATLSPVIGAIHMSTKIFYRT